MWVSFKRIMQSGLVGFWRNAFVSFSAIYVITLTLLVVGSTLLVDQLLGVSLAKIEDKVDIKVYFTTDAEQVEIDAFQKLVISLPEVRSVTLKTREQALSDFKQRHSRDELTMQALEELEDNPLGASLSILAEDTSQYGTIAQFIEEQQSLEPTLYPIDRVNYNRNKEAIERLTDIGNAIEHSSLIVLSVLLIAAFLITLNTIRLAIYTSKEEISVMRLVGASNTFIRGPFMVQGIMYGFVSGLIALIIVYFGLVWFGPKTELFFQFNLFDYFVEDFMSIFVVIVGSGVGLGLGSSLLAVSRYLRI